MLYDTHGNPFGERAWPQNHFQGEEHPYVRCVIGDTVDPARHFECRVLDEEDISTAVGEYITLEVIKVVTERRSGIVGFDCRLPKSSTHE